MLPVTNGKILVSNAVTKHENSSGCIGHNTLPVDTEPDQPTIVTFTDDGCLATRAPNLQRYQTDVLHNVSANITNVFTFVQPHDANEPPLDVQTLSYRQPATSMDKGKRKLRDVSNEEQPFAQTHVSASFPQNSKRPELLCYENFGMMDDTCQPLGPDQHSDHADRLSLRSSIDGHMLPLTSDIDVPIPSPTQMPRIRRRLAATENVNRQTPTKGRRSQVTLPSSSKRGQRQSESKKGLENLYRVVNIYL